MLKRLRSEGLTPSHLMSGVVRLLLSYDMFMLPASSTPSRSFSPKRNTRGLHESPEIVSHRNEDAPFMKTDNIFRP